MRLAQAARDLSVTTDDIISFLAKRGIEIEKDSNTKLSQESALLLFEHFDTTPKNQEQKSKTEEHAASRIASSDQEIESNAEPDIPTEQIHEAIIQQKTAEQASLFEPNAEENNLVEQKEQSEIEEPFTGETSTEEPEGPKEVAETEVESVQEKEHIGQQTSKKQETQYKTVSDILESEGELTGDYVIKAPKVSLQGLNILGKIDLPEPKAKTENEESEKPKKQPKKNELKDRKKEKFKRGKKEVSPQQLRDRENKIAQRKREEAERLAKKKKEKYYKEQVLKPKQEQQKKSKPKKSKQTIRTNVKEQQRPEPTTFLGKFWRWLNT